MQSRSIISARGIWGLCAAVLLCGCTSPYFDVDLSGLDVATLTVMPQHINANDLPVYRRVELSGSGHVLYKWGRSKRVINEFWSDPGEQTWHDLHQRQHVMPKEKTATYFQSLVDAGVFESQRRQQRSDAKGRMLLVQVKISRRVHAIGTTNPKLLKIFDQLVDEALSSKVD